jgi:hypothetical protein
MSPRSPLSPLEAHAVGLAASVAGTPREQWIDVAKATADEDPQGFDVAELARAVFVRIHFDYNVARTQRVLP